MLNIKDCVNVVIHSFGKIFIDYNKNQYVIIILYYNIHFFFMTQLKLVLMCYIFYFQIINLKNHSIQI